MTVLSQEPRLPIPPPPPIFDLLLGLLFSALAWLAWRRGGAWRGVAPVLWLLAFGGVLSFLVFR